MKNISHFTSSLEIQLTLDEKYHSMSDASSSTEIDKKSVDSANVEERDHLQDTAETENDSAHQDERNEIALQGHSDTKHLSTVLTEGNSIPNSQSTNAVEAEENNDKTQVQSGGVTAKPEVEDPSAAKKDSDTTEESKLFCNEVNKKQIIAVSEEITEKEAGRVGRKPEQIEVRKTNEEATDNQYEQAAKTEAEARCERDLNDEIKPTKMAAQNEEKNLGTAEDSNTSQTTSTSNGTSTENSNQEQALAKKTDGPLPLQQLCQEIQTQFQQNSIGLHTSLSKLDSRMAYIERMQFLIRKQSQDMLELKLRIAETEKKYSNEHKMISSYRKKVKELQQKLREMEIRNEVRDRTEREIEQREARRADQKSQEYMAMMNRREPQQPPQVVTVQQPMPIIMATNIPNAGFGGMQQPPPAAPPDYGHQQTQSYNYAPKTIASSSPRALPPSPNLTELPDKLPTNDSAASVRRTSVNSVKSYRSRAASHTR